MIANINWNTMKVVAGTVGAYGLGAAPTWRRPTKFSPPITPPLSGPNASV
jgi:hypothetical protein